jgi:hypothetical protein
VPSPDEVFYGIRPFWNRTSHGRRSRGIDTLATNEPAHVPIGELFVLYVEISRCDALRWFPPGGVFAEVGVFKGDFSRKIIDVVAPKQLHLIDVWKWTYLLVPVILGVLCGLRRGEIVALRWRQVDLANAQLAVVESAEQTGAGVRYKQPKSGRARTVALSPIVVEELRAHRLRQAEELFRLGARPNDATYLYTREDGGPFQPRSLTHAWQQMLAKTTLPRIRFHDLRHAHATHLLSSGIHPKVASERLGHSKVGITLDLYSHVLPGMQADAVTRVDEALRVAVQKRGTLGVG